MIKAYIVEIKTVDDSYISRQLVWPDAWAPIPHCGETYEEAYGTNGTLAPEKIPSRKWEQRTVIPLMHASVGVESISLLKEVIHKCTFMSSDLEERVNEFISKNNFEN